MVATGLTPFIRRTQRFVTAVGWRFYTDKCLLHASALAYTSVLSLVPLLALMFAVLKGLGVQGRLEPLLLSRLALSREVTEQVVVYIDRTNVGTLGALGAGVLLFTVLSVLGQIENSLNHIWRVRQSRTWLRKATDYLSAVLVTPFLLLAAVAVTSAAREQALLQLVLHTQLVGEAVGWGLRLAPIGINAIALAILYTVMPNRRPYLPGIAIGSGLAGFIWQFVHVSYVALGVGAARYNAIYGALSQVPITLVWIYVSWAVVLGGAEVAAMFEFGTEGASGEEVPTSQWALALHVLLRAAEAFRSDAGPLDPRAIARELRVDSETVGAVAEQLRQHGLLAAIEGSQAAFILARDARGIELAALDDILDHEAPPPGCDPRVRSALARVQSEGRRAWREQRLADLLDAPTSETPSEGAAVATR